MSTAPLLPPAPAPARLRADHLPATTLAELNAAAGLLTRVDRKYLVPLAAAQGLLDALSDQALVLQIDGLRRFRYASTYFDTPDLDSYYLAARRRRRRFKVRTRTYLDSSLCFLEVKTQGSRETTVKERLGYQPQDAARLTGAGRGYVASCLSEARVGDHQDAQHTASRLSPVLDSTYERTTLLLPAEGARLTIDTSLAWTAWSAQAGGAYQPAPAPRADQAGRTGQGGPAPVGQGGPLPPRRSTVSAGGPAGATPPGAAPAGGRTVLVDGLAVVETKTAAASSPADRLLWARGYRPVGISKYATAMAVLHPELPSNKWHRTLTRELADVTDVTGIADATAALRAA